MAVEIVDPNIRIDGRTQSDPGSRLIAVVSSSSPIRTIRNIETYIG